MVASESIMMVGVLALVGWMLWLSLRRFQIMTQVRQQRYEMIKGLIEKYGSAAELNELLQSEAGKRFFAEQSSGIVDTGSGALRFLQIGVVAAIAGAATLINAARLGTALSELFLELGCESQQQFVEGSNFRRLALRCGER